MTVRGLSRPILAALLVAFGVVCAWAAGPVETNIFAVQGVPVDVTSTDATAAKNQALMDVQVKAFFILVARLGSDDIAKSLEKMKPAEIAPYLKSLSIEQETSAPGRYIGTFTVRFMPDKMQKLLGGFNIHVPTRQSDPLVVLPVFRDPSGSKLWEDNPWRKAWLDLHAEQSLVPVIVPLGDFDDTSTLTAEDALNDDPIKIEAIRKRYESPSILVAVAEPAEGGGLHVVMVGDTKLGHMQFNKTYTAEDGSIAGAAAQAAERIHQLMIDKYKADEDKIAAADNTPHTLSVTVPFGSPTEWNSIRARILSTPNVMNVDVSTLSIDGAVIKLLYRSSVDALQSNMQKTGLVLSQNGQNWFIQPTL